MATMMVKSTYSLDVETAETLEKMAKRWKISKSEALRRAIRAAAGCQTLEEQPIQALDRLQEALHLSVETARRWSRRARSERRTSSHRREGLAR